MIHNLIEKWKMYKNKFVRLETLKEEVYNKTNIIEKNLKEIQTFFKDEIDIISDTKLNIKNFNLEKINDDEVGFCGTLEFVIFDYCLSIDRIGFANQVHISFHKNDISIIENSNSKYIGYLTYEQIINVYKTVNYFLINKEKIKEMLDKYISQQLNDKIKFISKEINKIENMDFIDDTQKKL